VNWVFNWPWLVVVLTADGCEVTQWRCETQRQANQERDRIQDAIMAGSIDVSAAWVKKDAN
jgi:hypothetical protein